MRIYAPVLVPGLVQTEEYARAVMRFVGEPEAQLEGRVAARIQRQEALTRDLPPEIVIVLDERIIRCPVGSPDVMREQLVRLAEAAERHLIQVVPLTAETYHGLAGPFEIATVDGVEVVYTDTQLRGYVSGSGEAVTEAKRRWEAIRAEALPRRQSIDTHGGGEVVEQLIWRKSSRSSSNGGSCVEVATRPDRVFVRDSKDQGGPTLSVTPAEWRAFLTILR